MTCHQHPDDGPEEEKGLVLFKFRMKEVGSTERILSKRVRGLLTYKKSEARFCSTPLLRRQESLCDIQGTALQINIKCTFWTLRCPKGYGVSKMLNTAGPEDAIFPTLALFSSF